MLEGRHYQNAYVTRDLEKAAAVVVTLVTGADYVLRAARLRRRPLPGRAS